MGGILARKISFSRRKLASSVRATSSCLSNHFSSLPAYRPSPRKSATLSSSSSFPSFFSSSFTRSMSASTLAIGSSLRSPSSPLEGAALANLGASLRRLHVKMLEHSPLRQMGDNKGSRAEAMKPAQPAKRGATRTTPDEPMSFIVVKRGSGPTRW
ncbi:unnamed protein product [Phaeothamnion confervicola]